MTFLLCFPPPTYPCPFPSPYWALIFNPSFKFMHLSLLPLMWQPSRIFLDIFLFSFSKHSIVSQKTETMFGSFYFVVRTSVTFPHYIPFIRLKFMVWLKWWHFEESRSAFQACVVLKAGGKRVNIKKFEKHHPKSWADGIFVYNEEAGKLRALTAAFFYI